MMRRGCNGIGEQWGWGSNGAQQDTLLLKCDSVELLYLIQVSFKVQTMMTTGLVLSVLFPGALLRVH